MARKHIIFDFETSIRPGELTGKEITDICRTLTTDFDTKVTAYRIPSPASGLFIGLDLSYTEGDLTTDEEINMAAATEDLLGVAGILVAVPEPLSLTKFGDLHATEGIAVTNLTMPANTSTKQVAITAILANPNDPTDFTVIGYYANPNDGGGQRYIDVNPDNIPAHHTHFALRTVLYVQAGHGTWPETFTIPANATLTVKGHADDTALLWDGNNDEDWVLTVESSYVPLAEVVEWCLADSFTYVALIKDANASFPASSFYESYMKKARVSEILVAYAT